MSYLKRDKMSGRIIRDCEIWYPKLSPKRPNTRFSKVNPTWEIQVRTQSRETKKYWLDCDLKPKDVLPDEGEPYFRLNFKKRTIKANGEEAAPVEVINGNMDDVDPNTIGNGSVGNVRIFQYAYDNTADGGEKGIATILMGIQLTKHILYKAKSGESFEEEETEVIALPDEEEEVDKDLPFEPDEKPIEEPTKAKSDTAGIKIGNRQDAEAEF